AFVRTPDQEVAKAFGLSHNAPVRIRILTLALVGWATVILLPAGGCSRGDSPPPPQVQILDPSAPGVGRATGEAPGDARLRYLPAPILEPVAEAV
ncbi:MAG: hypothetical protein M3541_20745, partial [Acidobacteriota bacterium]|nr:hypothetical protein [Acidobacteriota bacterium]